ncbi:uncharacterized protein METZ01_LOCUS115445 [marine metagenome]|uniref:Uncharacterized protein n=1 Tax=marine metagenome TaxID=408172 RepID=A0A381XDN3_9ZZZZ
MDTTPTLGNFNGGQLHNFPIRECGGNRLKRGLIHRVIEFG